MADTPSHEEEHRLIAERKRKMQELRDAGIEPYPHKFAPTSHAVEVQKAYASLDPEQKSGEVVSVAGRIILMRRMGKLSFATLLDGSGSLQIMFRVGDTVDTENLRLVDLGDFLGIEGEIVKSKSGEVSILAKKWVMLAKSIRPLPEKHKGLADEELRARKRYLDLIVNPSVREMFFKRAKIIQATRDVLHRHHFLEVETPALQTVYGGANARPFLTHINAWDMRMYLSISPELYLKRLLVGGYERVYTICKNFRNEGVDRTHNPEFTMMECYAAYWDYNDMMSLTEEIYEESCKAVNGSTKVMCKGVELDFKRPWKRVTFKDAIKIHGGIDVDALSDDDLRALIVKHTLGISADSSRGEIMIALFEHFAEDKLIQPTHIIDHPVESTPLCKTMRSGDVSLIERFESFAMGTELSNAYSELNDPVRQKELFELQVEKGRGGDEEAHPMDADYLEAMEHGMPPAGGLGIGIDRMVIFLTGAEGIRDVILFPTVKPE